MPIKNRINPNEGLNSAIDKYFRRFSRSLPFQPNSLIASAYYEFGNFEYEAMRLFTHSTNEKLDCETKEHSDLCVTAIWKETFLKFIRHFPVSITRFHLVGTYFINDDIFKLDLNFDNKLKEHGIYEQ